eukprot:g43481.t1
MGWAHLACLQGQFNHGALTKFIAFCESAEKNMCMCAIRPHSPWMPTLPHGWSVFSVTDNTVFAANVKCMSVECNSDPADSSLYQCHFELGANLSVLPQTLKWQT